MPIFTAQRYASAVCAMTLCQMSARPFFLLSLCHKPVLYQKGWN